MTLRRILTSRIPGSKLKVTIKPIISGYMSANANTLDMFRNARGEHNNCERFVPRQSLASTALAIRCSLMLWLWRVRHRCSSTDTIHSASSSYAHLPKLPMSRNLPADNATGIPSFVPVRGGSCNRPRSCRRISGEPSTRESSKSMASASSRARLRAMAPANRRRYARKARQAFSARGIRPPPLRKNLHMMRSCLTSSGDSRSWRFSSGVSKARSSATFASSS
mmetsp:Transcript_13711/g.34746  ORF Transcript_13711/g.34746 Transcript_13711/m.34746 type:complete len:223 (+) Transcript_13711:172-840(+)